MVANRTKYDVFQMYCTKCGQQGISIPRRVGKYKEAGHLKKIYCPHCKQEWNHVEIKPICADYTYEDFQLEMQYHNFNENGERNIPYRTFRGELKKKGII